MEKNGDVYVTYKWLLVQGGVLLLITLGFIYFVYGSIDKAMDSKADIMWVEQRANLNSARIDILMGQLDKMEKKQDETLKELYNINRNVQKNKER